MFYMSTRLLKYNIDGILVPQLKLYYIRNITNTLHQKWLSFAMTCIMCGGGTKSWNFKSGNIKEFLKIQESELLLC